MSDPQDYVPKPKTPLQRENEKRYPPRTRGVPIPEGQDYFSLIDKHGKIYGVFDKGRQHPYRGGK